MSMFTQPGCAITKGIVKCYKSIERCAVSGYKKIETGAVNGYKKMETVVVKGFCKFMDDCIMVLFSKEGETVSDTKARLSDKRGK